MPAEDLKCLTGPTSVPADRGPRLPFTRDLHAGGAPAGRARAGCAPPSDARVSSNTETCSAWADRKQDQRMVGFSPRTLPRAFVCTLHVFKFLGRRTLNTSAFCASRSSSVRMGTTSALSRTLAGIERRRVCNLPVSLTV